MKLSCLSRKIISLLELVERSIISRDKTSLDIFWVKDQSLTDLDNLPDPDVLALEIIDNIESGLASFREIVSELDRN